MRLQNRGKDRVQLAGMRLACALAILMCAGCSPSIHDYAARGDVEAVGSLLQVDPDLIGSTNGMGKTPLHYAASHNRLDSIKALLPHHPDVNAQDGTGMTALHICAGRNFRPLLRELIQAGADVSIQDDFGDTPLHAAAMHGATECANDLLKVKANPWERNKEGLTPMDLARRFGHDDIANRFGLMTPTPPDESDETR